MVSIALHVFVAQSLSHVWLSATPWTAAHQAPLASTISQTLLRFMSIELVILSNHLILCISSYCLPSFPAPESFPVSWLFESGGQSIGASASVSVFPMNNQGWFPLEWTGLISLQSKGPTRIFSDTTGRKHQFFGSQPFFMVQLSHLYITTGKNIASTIWTFMSKVISLLLNMLSWFIIAF